MKYFKCERCGTYYQEGTHRCCVWRKAVEITKEEFITALTGHLQAEWFDKALEMQEAQ